MQRTASTTIIQPVPLITGNQLEVPRIAPQHDGQQQPTINSAAFAGYSIAAEYAE